MQNKDFSANNEELEKVLRLQSHSESELQSAFAGMWQKVLKIYHGISVRQRLIVLTSDDIAERAVRKVEEGTSTILLQCG